MSIGSASFPLVVAFNLLIPISSFMLPDFVHASTPGSQTTASTSRSTTLRGAVGWLRPDKDRGQML